MNSTIFETAQYLFTAIIGGLLVYLFFSRKINKLIRYHDKELMEARIEIHEQVSHEIGSEIHDNIGSNQSIISFLLANLRNKIDPENRPELDETISLFQKNSIEIRNISRSLSAFQIYNFDFFECLEMALDRLTNNKLFSVNYFFEGSRKSFQPQIGFVLYRIFQEIIQNIIKHAQATKIDVKIERKPTVLTLVFTDNGIGFDHDWISKTKTASRGMGLTSIKKRVDHLGGGMTISSIPGKGTSIIIKVKL